MHQRSLRRLPALAFLLVLVLAACTGQEALPAPTIEAVSPTLLPSAGGTLTVTGTNFYRIDGDAPIRVESCGVTQDAVLADGELHTITIPPSSTVRTIRGETLTVSVPPNATAGVSDVIVTRPDGRSAVLEGALECQAPPEPSETPEPPETPEAPEPEPDTTPPALTVSDPAAIELGATVTITGTASDDTAITDLTLTADDTTLASRHPVADQLPITLTDTTWSITWTPEHPDAYDLVVTASDAHGNASTATTTLTVEHDYSLVTNTHDAGYGSLRSALAHTSNEPITFDFDVYDGSKTIHLESPLQIVTPTIINGNIGMGIILHGGGEHRIIENPDGHDLTMRDLTLFGGRAPEPDGDGGALLIGSGSDTTVHLERVVVEESRARNGGGIHATAATLILERSRVRNNTATGDGGGIHATTDRLTLDDQSHLTANTAGGDGGGIYAHSDRFLVQASWVSSNSAQGNGGGIYAAGTGMLALTDYVQLIGNRADGNGGGLHAHYPQISFNDADVENNHVYYDGGGAHLTTPTDGDSLVRVEGGEFRGNSASFDGAGLYVDGARTLATRDAYLDTNIAGDEGGGAYAINIGDASFTSSFATFVDNSARTRGGGLYLQAVTYTHDPDNFRGNGPDDAFVE